MVMSVSRCSLYDDVLQVHAYIYIYIHVNYCEPYINTESSRHIFYAGAHLDPP